MSTTPRGKVAWWTTQPTHPYPPPHTHAICRTGETRPGHAVPRMRHSRDSHRRVANADTWHHVRGYWTPRVRHTPTPRHVPSPNPVRQRPLVSSPLSTFITCSNPDRGHRCLAIRNRRHVHPRVHSRLHAQSGCTRTPSPIDPPKTSHTKVSYTRFENPSMHVKTGDTRPEIPILTPSPVTRTHGSHIVFPISVTRAPASIGTPQCQWLRHPGPISSIEGRLHRERKARILGFECSKIGKTSTQSPHGHPKAGYTSLGMPMVIPRVVTKPTGTFSPPQGR